MWNSDMGPLPEPNTMVQFLLSPVKTSSQLFQQPQTAQKLPKNVELSDFSSGDRLGNFTPNTDSMHYDKPVPRKSNNQERIDQCQRVSFCPGVNSTHSRQNEPPLSANGRQEEQEESVRVQEQLRSLSTDLASCREQLSETESRLAQRTHELETSCRQLLTKTEEVGRLQQELTGQTSSAEQLLAQVHSLQQEAQQLRQHHQKEIEQLSSVDSPMVRQLLEERQQQWSSERQQLMRTSAEAAMKQSRDIDRLKTALIHFRTKFTELKSENTELEMTIEELKESLAGVNKAVHKLEKDKSSLQQENDRLGSEVSSLELNRDQLQEALTKSLNQIRRLESEVKSEVNKAELHSAEARNSQQMAKEANCKMREMAEQCFHMEREMDRKKELLHQLTLQQEATCSDLNTWRQDLKSAKARLCELKVAVEKIVDQQSELHVLEQTLRVDVDRVKSCGTEEKHRADRLEKKLKKILIEKEDMSKYMKQLEDDLAKETEKNSEWNSLWESKMEQINNMEKAIKVKMTAERDNDKLEEIRAERDRALSLAKQAAVKLQTVDEQYAMRLQQVKTAYETELRKLRSENDRCVRSSYSRLNEIEETVRDISDEMSSSRNSLDQKMRRVRQIIDGFEVAAAPPPTPTTCDQQKLRPISSARQ